MGSRFEDKEGICFEIKATNDDVHHSHRDDDNQANIIVDVGRLVFLDVVQVENQAQNYTDDCLGCLKIQTMGEKER